MSVPAAEADCFLHIPQEFLVCTTIHKAKNLPVLNADTYVKVSLGKTTKMTKVFHNSENPYYNEYFVFEVPCTLAELLRLTVLYEVRRRTCCKTHVTLGELLIDLHTVWNQPHMSFCKKWGKLVTSGGSAPSAAHLQLDLAIVSPNQPAFAPPLGASDADDVESNLLQDLGMPPSNVRYQIALYSGVFLKKADYMLQVALAGTKAKTKVCKATMSPEWSEQLQFNWTYPSLAQTLALQVMCRETMSWKCIADSETYLDEVSFGASPSLGPTWMHFYDVHDYVGRVSIEISTEKLTSTRETIGRTISVGPKVGFAEGDWWTEEAFLLEFLTWQGAFVQANASNMKLHMSLAEHKSDGLECLLKSYSSHKTTRKHFEQAPPFKAVHIRCFLPDNRLKYEADQFMLVLVEQMRSEMESFKLLQLKYPQEESMHRKSLKAIILTLLDRAQHPQSLRYNGFKRQSTWDGNRLTFLREFFGRFAATLKELRDDLKAARGGGPACSRVCQALRQLRGQIESIMQTRIQDEWPELQLHMSLGGGKAASKKFAICKLNARHFVFSQRSECLGPWCGVPRNFVFKDASCMHTCRNCGCLKGVLYGWLRIAAESEQAEFAGSADWEQKERFYYQPREEASLVVCRVYVHQAKVQPGADSTGLCDAKLRLAFGEQVMETSTVTQSLAPVWDETVAFAARRMAGPLRWYQDNPPLLPIELFDVDKLRVDDYLGCGLVELSFPKSAQIEISQQGPKDAAARPAAASAIFNLKRTRVAVEKLREVRYLSPPTLKWTPIAHMGASRVEILLSGELLQVAEDEQAALVAGIPIEIQPSMGKYLLEVTFIGLRNCQKMASSSLGRYRIHVMMGELLLRSGVSGTRLKNSVNFLENFAAGIVSLPKQLQYWPPIIATQVDCPGRSREVTLAATLISDPSKYLRREESSCDLDAGSSVVQVSEDEESAPLLPARSVPKKCLCVRLKDCLRGLVPRRTSGKEPTPRPAVDESNYTWWTKFYNSLHLEQDIESAPKHKLVIYDCELEKQPAFSHLTDCAEPFPLIHGVKIKKNQPPKEEVFATLKMHLQLSPCSCNSANTATLASAPSRISSKIQSLSAMNEELKVLVRVYLVQGMNFRSHDAHSQSDSYVRLQLGSQVISDRANYVCNQSNPVYGKRFQLPATIPREHVLQVSVYDRGGAGDDLIGSTFIDLEDRVRSQHRATVGIADEFSRSGYNAWRDVATPHQILLDVCRKKNLGLPKFEANSVEVDGVTFAGDESAFTSIEDSRERLSLRVLKSLDALPSVGYRLVPEHVETRSLYRADRPGVEQGKLQLWIEIFDSGNVPPPMDITPTAPRMYELRVVVYNCADVPFQERNVFGTNMSDIYIKGWCADNEASQRTDVHYRSLTGEGSFNWRMIFPLKYSPAEDMMVIRRKGGLFEVFETKQPPMVYLQIWEDDVLSPDDFVGAMDLCLSHFPEPFATRAACTERAIKRTRRRFVNLFQEKTARGWFPCRGPSEKDDYTVTGKLELGLEILSDRDAAAKPAGLGRSPPAALPAPDRPDTSFNPWSSPLKSIKHILAPAIMKCVRAVLVVVLVGVLLYALFNGVLKELLRKA